MTDVIDKSTNQVTSLPDEQIADAWKSGKVRLIQGQQYQFQAPNGDFIHAPAEKAASIIAQGANFASRDAAVAAQNEAQYGGIKGQAIAAVSGLASQGTLGISDQLLPQSWLKAEQKYQEQNPVASMVGKGAGAAALAALTGGTTAAESLGAAATEGLGESMLARVAQRAVAGGLRDAVAGAQYGLAQTISDDAISNHKLSAEHVLSTIGGNTLWGGAIGAGLGGLGGLLHGAAPEVAEGKPGPLADALAKSPSDEAVGKIAATIAKVDQPAEGLGSKLRDWAIKMVSATSGKDPEALATFFGPDGAANRAALLDAEATRDGAMRDIRTHGDSIIKASKDVEEVWQRGMKRSYIASSLDGVDADAAAARARSLADHAITTLNEMIDNADKYGDSEAAKATLNVAHQYSHKLDAAIADGDVAEMYGLTDDLKKAIAKPAAKSKQLIAGAQPNELRAMQVSARQQAWTDLHAAVQVGLEDQGVWGKMGEAQANINKAYTGLIDSRKRFNSALVTDIGRDPNDLWSKAYGIDPAKVGGYVRGLMSPEKDLTHQAIQDYLSNSKLLSQTFADHFELPAGKLASVQKIADSAQAFQDTLDKASKSLSLVNQFEHVRGVASGNGAMLGAGLGMLAHGFGGGIAGMALGRLAGVFTRPGNTIMHLATIEKMARDNEGLIGRSLRAFGAGSARAANGPELASYARKTAQVQRMLASPETLAERVGQNTSDLRSHAPKLADAMVDTSLAGLALLRDKMPPTLPGDPLDPHAPVPLPSPAMRETWLRYHEAVERPMSVVENLRDGRINPEGVEVLQTVYPQLYAEVQRITYEQMADGKLPNLSHQQRIGLGLMLQIPADPTLAPGYIAARQAAFQAPVPTPADSQGTESSRPRRPVNLAKTTTQTAVERIEASPTSG